MSNVVLNPAAGGATIATDQVTGVDYQKMKVTFSTDGVAPTSVDATHPLPITGVAASGAAVSFGAGNTDTGTQRMVLATDQPSLSNAIPVLQSGTWTVTTAPPANASANITQVGGVALSEGQKAMAASVPVVIASDQSAVPVSGTITTTPPANASTNLTQVGGVAVSLGAKTSAASIPVVLATDEATLPVSIAATVTVAGTITANQGGAPWSENITQFGGNNVVTGVGNSGVGIPRVTVSSDSIIASITAAVATTPPANASTNITQVGGVALSEGQKAMAASVPVVIASDQSAVPVSGTVTTTPPANASTNIAQVGGAALSEGQKAMAASVPVVIASDQSTLPVSAASLPLPAGAATSALQTAAASGAALETGGNLALIVSLLTFMQQQVDLSTKILAVLQASRLQDASAYGVAVEPDTLIPDYTFN